MEWQKLGACYQRQDTIRYFFPPLGADMFHVVNAHNNARRICSSCDVRAECLAYALETPWLHGVWGGKNEEERLEIRRKRDR